MANLYKGKSKIHGLGIFAGELISEGEMFYDAPMDAISNVSKERCAFIGEGRWLCDEDVLNWVNHSCKPNADLVINKDTVSLKAIRDIGVGDEITCDYDKTETDGQKISCNCQAENCKGYFLRVE